MKPQVPAILAKFYQRHDPAANLHEIKTADLPEIGTLYRDNTTGIIWEVLAHSGSDLYQKEPTDPYYWDNPMSLHKKDNERDRLVILQSVEPEGVTMHLKPAVLKSTIHSSEHYTSVVKKHLDIPRFEEVEESNESLPFWNLGVKTMTMEKALKKLTSPTTTSLHVLNVYPTPHGLADLMIEYLDENSVVRQPRIAKINATWLPQDILQAIPREALLKNQTFRKYLSGGFIQVITNGSAKRIRETEEYAAEAERMNQQNPVVKMARPRQGMI